MERPFLQLRTVRSHEKNIDCIMVIGDWRHCAC